MADTPKTDAPIADPPSLDSVDDGTGSGTQPPEGFVPVADLEREKTRSRTFQSEADRLRGELSAKNDPPAGGAGGANPDDALLGFDPAEFRRSLLSDVSQATRLTLAVPSLQAEFPEADQSIYLRLHEFGSADALRLAVEDSHNRVASIVDARVAAREQALRAEFEAAHGGGSNGPPAGPAEPGADPTRDQIASMSLAELSAFEAERPGVVERVLRSV